METKPGYHDTKDDLLKRLRRIEGQVRGLQRMVEADTYCIDILTQVAAATKALQSVAVGLLEEHMRHCVADAVASGGDEADRLVTEASRGHRTTREELTARRPRSRRHDVRVVRGDDREEAQPARRGHRDVNFATEKAPSTSRQPRASRRPHRGRRGDRLRRRVGLA